MRILHLIAQKPGNTGSGIYLRALVSYFSEKNYRQTVIAGISNKDAEYIFPDNVLFTPVIFDTDDLPFPVVGMSDIMPYESTKYSALNDKELLLWKKAFSDTICKTVEDFAPDFILSHHLWLLTSLVIEKYPSIPVFGFCHNTGLRQIILAPHLADNILQNFRKISKIFSLSQIQKNEISRIYNINKSKIIVSRAGYNSKIFFPLNDKHVNNEITLVYCGILSFA